MTWGMQVLARHQGRRTLARWRYALRCRQEEAELHRRAAGEGRYTMCDHRAVQ